jgi:hypothetical protein
MGEPFFLRFAQWAFGLLGKLSVNHFYKNFILEMYRESDSFYKNENRLGTNWWSISQDLELSFQFSTRYCNEPSKVAIRNKADNSIDKVVVHIEAERWEDGFHKDECYTREQELTFNSVNSIPKVNSLHNIPKVDLWISEDGKIIRSYENLSIRLISINEEIINRKIGIHFLTHSQLLDDLYKGNWVEKSGKYYHIGYINVAKNNLKGRIWRDFSSNAPLQGFLKSLLLQDKILSARFWLLIILKGYKIDDYGYLEFDEYKISHLMVQRARHLLASKTTFLREPVIR